MVKHLRIALPALLVLTVWTQSALARLPEVADLAERAGASVVNISTKVTVAQSDRPQMPGLPKGTPFDDFFERFFGERGQQPPRQRGGQGSGFIISRDGFILTNNHVVEKADEVTVRLRGDDKPYTAEVLGTDPETDLALIKIKTDTRLKPLDFADSDGVRVGDWVVAIGNPFGLDHTVTLGIISAKGRVIGAGPYDDFLQTDASINPGNSGGPLLNMDGEVVGINTAIVASGQGIGFAIPSNLAQLVTEQLKDHGKVRRGFVGVTIQDIDENTAKALGLGDTEGALVAGLAPDGPAKEAGLKEGDVITHMDGAPIVDSRSLTQAVGEMAPGQAVTLRVVRKGDIEEYRITLAERPSRRLAQGPEVDEPDTLLGMTLKALGEEEAKALGMDEARGVIVADVGGPAAAAGVARGDVILEINQRGVNSPAEAREVIEGEAADKGVALLLLYRRGQNRFVTVPVE